MFFSNLSIFQNILFDIACIGILLLLVYIICYSAGLTHKKSSTTSDDIDNCDEDFKEPRKFIYNAFTIKGSIFFLVITSVVGFVLSLILNIWIAILVGAVLGVGTAILFAYIDRDKPEQLGEIAIVSETIPAEESGFGKVIIASDGSEIEAKTSHTKPLKKGKKVVVSKTENNSVLVKKYKRH